MSKLLTASRKMRTRFARLLCANKVNLQASVESPNRTCSASEFDRRTQLNKRTTMRVVLLFNGGSDENRTRVQKSFHTTFSVGSQSIEIPASERRLTGSRQGSFLMHDRYKSNSRFTCTTNLTHGRGRSPPRRYGRHY